VFGTQLVNVANTLARASVAAGMAWHSAAWTPWQVQTLRTNIVMLLSCRVQWWCILCFELGPAQWWPVQPPHCLLTWLHEGPQPGELKNQGQVVGEGW